MSSRNNARVNLYLPGELVARLDAIIPAVERRYPGFRLSRNAAIRGAIEQWVRQEEEREAGKAR